LAAFEAWQQSPKGWLRLLLAPLRILTKDGRLAKLGDVWNYAQLTIIDETERQIMESGQVRIIDLKARQIGQSTVIEAILFTFAIYAHDFSSMVMSHEKDSSQHLLSMSTRYWDNFIAKRLRTEKYKGRSQLAWEDNNSQMIIKTAKNEESGRSNTIHALHASEVAFWPVPEVVMDGLQQSLPSFGLTFIYLESTANGVGNYFHKMCMQSMRGQNEYTFLFFPWHEHPEYTASYIPKKMRDKYAQLADATGDQAKEEAWLRDVLGLDEGRLVWRRWCIANKCRGDINKFRQEYPSTPHEAFITTGRNVFPFQELVSHYRPMKGKRGVLRRGYQGKIEFVPRSDGWLTVYSYPSSDESWGIYLAGGDPTHTLTGDNAVVQVLNRRTQEQVAVYRNKIQPIRFGKHMQLVGHWYNEALLAPEREGPGYATVGCIVGDGYTNVYQGTDQTSAQGKIADAYGWSTNSKTKDLAISTLLHKITEPLSEVNDTTYGLVIHDELTLMEMRDYVTLENGKFGNSDGSEYDDGVMALAIAVTVDDIEPPPGPYTAPDAHTAPTMKNAGKKVSKKEMGLLDDDDDDFDDPYKPAPWESWGQS
jgi:hypothetical protein